MVLGEKIILQVINRFNISLFLFLGVFFFFLGDGGGEEHCFSLLLLHELWDFNFFALKTLLCPSILTRTFLNQCFVHSFFISVLNSFSFAFSFFFFTCYIFCYSFFLLIIFVLFFFSFFDLFFLDNFLFSLLIIWFKLLFLFFFYFFFLFVSFFLSFSSLVFLGFFFLLEVVGSNPFSFYISTSPYFTLILSFIHSFFY